MRNKVKRTLSFLLTFVMLCSLLPAMAMAKEPEGRYEEVAGVEALVEDAEVHVFTTKGAGDIVLTDANSNTFFAAGSGYRQYTASEKEGWVFDTWRYEQLYKGENLGNRTDMGWGKRYSFSNEGDSWEKWQTPYTGGNNTISVNRLTPYGETVGNPIIYNIYADFNPTITATAGDNGTIFNGEKPVDAKEPVEVEYGKDQTFEIKANDGYVIDTIKVDGNVVEENVNKVSDTYTFENVAEPHNIDVTFRKTEVGECTVTYEVFGEFPADYVIPESVTVNEGDIYTVADVPPNVTTDEGTYTFKGWYNGEIKVGDTIEVTSDVTLTGTWTFDGKDDVWNAVYGSIRVYMDEGTKADFDKLQGSEDSKQVRLYSEEYPIVDVDGNRYRLCVPSDDYWGTTNIAERVTANDISEIVLAKDKAIGSSEKINIPMTGNEQYTVAVTEDTDKLFGLIPYTYLKISITKNDDPVDPTTPVEDLPVFLYVLNQTDGETTDDPANYSYLATGAKVKAGTSMETPYTGEDAQNQIENWDQLKELGTHVGYAEVSSTPVGAESTWKMDENGNVISFSFIIDGVTYTDADYDFTWQKLNYIGASYKENEEDEELKPAFHLDGVLTEKEDPVDPENPEWQVSKGKTATALDSNYNSTVTLSLPSAEKPLVSDVVFVLDKSTSATVENQALGMLKQLKEKATEDGATVKVGVVIFNKEAHVTERKDLVTEYDAIEEAIKQEISSGTNTHAGLLAAQEMLAADTDVEDSRKHMIFVSDGITYMFEEPAQAINSQQATNGEYAIMAGNDCWGIRHYDEGGDQFIPNDWNTYLQDVESHLDEVKQYIQPYDNMNQDNHIPRGDTELPTTVDVALYKTAKLYHELGEKYHCYAVLGDTGVTNYPWGPDFMTYLADGKEVSFADIQNDIYYLLAAGSQVVDIIGQGEDNKGNNYNFDVVNLENMTITVGGVELNKVKIQSAEFPGRTTYGFFKGEIADGKYDFVVTYYPDGVADADGETREHFVWSINVPVGNFAPAQFSYDVHLTDPQTTKGTYTVATNVEAVLTPVDSNGTKGKPEKFPVPELTYEVKGGGSGEDYRYVNVTVVGKGDVDYKCGDHKGTITEKDGTELLTLDLFENSMKFNMEPASGWKLDRIEVNGKDVGKDLEYKMIFDEVTGDQMDIDVKIVFKEKSDGGSGGGSHRPSNKPDKTPEALNGDDHFDYVVGYSDGLVHPERNITRAEVASIFFRLLQDDVREKNLTDQNPFNDVFTDDWFNVAVSTMYDMDIVYGRDNNNFDPNAYITRAEFAAIAARFDSEGYSGENLFTDIDGHWAANQINRAAEKGWISGYPDGTFGPDRYITRAEAVTMINRVLNRLPESADALHEDMNVFPDNMDTTAWYYLAIQEATSSHEYEKDKDGVYETWTDVLPDRDWAQYLKLN